MEAKFFVCEHCGNLVGMIHDAQIILLDVEVDWR